MSDWSVMPLERALCSLSCSRLTQLPLFLERQLALPFLIIVKDTRFVRRKHSGAQAWRSCWSNLLRGDAHAYDVGWDATRECVVTGLHGHSPQPFVVGARILTGQFRCLRRDYQHRFLCRILLVEYGELIPGDLRVVCFVP